jgi:4-methyl-5(b-hydroxyethyl)-thiazole monophosphate biosynthesis
MKKILLFLADGFEFFEASVFIDVMGWNLAEGDGTTQLFTCGLRKEINSSFNQKLIVDYVLEEIDMKDFDALAVPGGFEIYGFYNDAYNERFLSAIRNFNDAGKTIASICVGALPLGKSGILAGKNGTTYNSTIRREALQSFGVNVLHQPVVVDDNIITSWNPSTAMDVAFLLLEKLTNKENTDNVRRLMGFKVQDNSSLQ